MTLVNQPAPEHDYENQKVSADLEEFQGLINPFVDRRESQKDHRDKDFEPNDPGWLYPDRDGRFFNNIPDTKSYESEED